MSNTAFKEFEYSTGQEMYSDLSGLHMRYEHQQIKFDMTGADIVNIHPHTSGMGKTKYPLWSFFLGKSPLKALVYRDGDYWFAEIDDLNVSSEGASPSEAISYLEEEVRHFIDFYQKSNANELTAYALELSDKFAEIVPQD